MQNLNDQEIKSIEILGFTDLSGTFEINDVLSEKRAYSVKEFLLEKKLSHLEKLSVNLSVEGKGVFQGNVSEKEKRKVEIIWTTFPVQN